MAHVRIRSIADLPAQTAGALLIGVDLGPNLSITGSLATLLWLIDAAPGRDWDFRNFRPVAAGLAAPAA